MTASQDMIYSCSGCGIFFTAMSFHSFREATGSNIKCDLCGTVATFVAPADQENLAKYKERLEEGRKEVDAEKGNVRISLGFDGISGVYIELGRETQKAVLLEQHAYNDGAVIFSREAWLPKSQIRVVDAGRMRFVSVPVWLYEKKREAGEI